MGHGSFGQFRQKYGLISPNFKMLLYLWYAFKGMQKNRPAGEKDDFSVCPIQMGYQWEVSE